MAHPVIGEINDTFLWFDKGMHLWFDKGMHNGDIDEFIRASEHGCSTYKSLLRDKEFENYVSGLIHLYQYPIVHELFRDVTINQENYLYFLKEEKDLLLNNGMAPDLVDVLILEAHQLLEAIKNFEESRPSTEFLFTLIRRVGNQCCDLEEILSRNKVKDDHKLIEILLRSIFGLGGAGIITINGIVATNIGPISAVSLALGSVFIDRAIGPLHMPRRDY